MAPPADIQRFGRWVALTVVEICIIRGRHYHIVLCLSGLDTSFNAAPTHDRGIRRQAAFEDLVPADHSFAELVDYFFHTPDKIALHLILVLEPFALFKVLHKLRFLPDLFRSFVAADMNV